MTDVDGALIKSISIVLEHAAKTPVSGHRTLREECVRDARAVVEFLKSRGLLAPSNPPDEE